MKVNFTCEAGHKFTAEQKKWSKTTRCMKKKGKEICGCQAYEEGYEPNAAVPNRNNGTGWR